MTEREQLHNEPILLLRIAQSDEAAFRSLVHHYQPVIYFTAFRMTGNKDMAEDIVQDAFLKVWLHRSSLPDIANFGGWLYRIAENLVLNAFNRLNHEKKYSRQVLDTSALHHDTTAEKIEQKELELILHKAVNSLPPRQLEAYRLIKEQGKTRSEAADLMNVHPETVKSNLEHAMRYIRAYCLKEWDRYPPEILLLIFFQFFF